MKSKIVYGLINVGAVLIVCALGFLVYAYQQQIGWFANIEKQDSSASTTAPWCSAPTKLMTLAEFRRAFDAGQVKVSLSSQGVAATALVDNQTDCTAPLVLNSYKMYNDNIAEQTIFAESTQTMQPRTTTTLNVNLPQCKAQVDLFYYQAGSILTEATFQDHLIAWDYGKNSSVFCQPDSSKPSLNFEKTGPAQAQLNQELTYTVRISNVGNGPANDVVVRDRYPENFVFLSSLQEYCKPAGANVVECPVGDIPAGSSRSLEFTFRLNTLPSCGQQLANSAELTSSNHPSVTRVANTQTAEGCTAEQVPDVPVCPVAGGSWDANKFWEEFTAGRITADIKVESGKAFATVQNNSACAFPLSGSTYKIYNYEKLSTQKFFSGSPLQTLASGGKRTMELGLPDCHAQIDLWYGQYVTQLVDDPVGQPSTYGWGRNPSIFKALVNKSGNICTDTTPPPPPVSEESILECNPRTRTLLVDEQATFTVKILQGTQNRFLIWAAPSSVNTGQQGQNLTSFSTSYKQPGSYKVSVSSQTPGNDISYCAVNVTKKPDQTLDLKVEKFANPSLIQVGDSTVFKVKVTNLSAKDAHQVVLKDLVPQGLLYIVHAVSQGGYAPVTGVWTVGDLSAGQSATLDITTKGQSVGVKTNTAQLTGVAEVDSNPDNNQASATVTVTAPPVPPLSCTPGIQTVQVGGTAVFAAMGGSGSFSWSAAQGTPSTGQEPVFSTSYADSGEKQVRVVSGEQSAVCKVNVQPPAPQPVDLMIEKQVSPNIIYTGEGAVFTLKVRNISSITASDVEVADMFPSGLQIQNISVSSGTYQAGVWRIGALLAGEIKTLTATVTGLGVGSFINRAEIVKSTPFDNNSSNNYATATLVVRDRVVSSNPPVYCLLDREQADVGSSITATAVGGNGQFSWQSQTTSPSTGSGQTFSFSLPSSGLHSIRVSSGSTTATCQVLAMLPRAQLLSADLSLVKSVDRTTVSLGSELAFHLVLTNSGPDTATAVEVRETLPASFRFVRFAASRGFYTSQTGIWQVGDLPSGQSATLVLVVKADKAGKFINVAEVSKASTADPDSVPGNGSVNEDDYATAEVSVGQALAQSGLPLAEGIVLPAMLAATGLYMFRRRKLKRAKLSLPQGQLPLDF